ncbi:GNAT family N-acetyltransferase [Rhodoferax sp.]|uniref:GNAT family N-acetyltransferase n=1 Tax=Rhodoferax sp. TaxID=50421 RepID=UPI00374CFA62
MFGKFTKNSHQEYSSVKASLLDVPFIFDLMMNGCELGAFSDRYMKGTGGIRLFWFILRGIFTQSSSARSIADRSNWYIFSMKRKEIGFMYIETSQATNGTAVRHVALFGIHPRYRSQGHGTAVLKLFIVAQPTGTSILVHCTKFARAMQHVLKRLRFIRNPKSGYLLEKYCFVKL